jgi:hypothetical protein
VRRSLAVEGTATTIDRSDIMEENTIVRIEEIRVTGDDLLARIKGLIHEGNVRRIIIKTDEGRELIEIPLTLGIVGAALMPVLAAVGAIAALAANLAITVVKHEQLEAVNVNGVPIGKDEPGEI